MISQDIPNVKELLSPVLDMVYEIQTERDDTNLKDVSLKNIDIWKAFVSVDSYTKDIHTYDDCTYTVMYIPM